MRMWMMCFCIVLYAQIGEWRVMKCGTTSDFRKRMKDYA